MRPEDGQGREAGGDDGDEGLVHAEHDLGDLVPGGVDGGRDCDAVVEDEDGAETGPADRRG